MTRAELRNIVRARLGNRTDKDAVIHDGLNLGLAHSLARHPFKLNVSVSDIPLGVGGVSVALPTNLGQLAGVLVIDGTFSRTLETRPKSYVVERWPDVTAVPSGEVVLAYEEGGTLFVAPMSDKAVTLRVTFFPKAARMTVDGDSNPIEVLDAAICDYATATVMRSLEKFAEAREWDAAFGRELAAAIQADRRRPGLTVQMQPHPSLPPGYNPPDPADVFAHFPGPYRRRY